MKVLRTVLVAGIVAVGEAAVRKAVLLHYCSSLLRLRYSAVAVVEVAGRLIKMESR